MCAGIAGRCRQFEHAHDHLAVDPPQAQLEPPGALPLPFQLARHVGGEIGQHGVEQGAVADRLHQAALDQRHLHGDDRQQRLGHAAEQLVQPGQRVGGGRAAGAEAALQRIAADARQAGRAA